MNYNRQSLSELARQAINTIELLNILAKLERLKAAKVDGGKQ